jgi:alanine or glycine:cation symporter, AGCS family
VTAAVDYLNYFLWKNILVWVLLGAGIYFTVRLRVVQFRRLPSLFGVLRHSAHSDRDETISSFKAFATSLGSKVGTGNIVGVAVAIKLGGPGAVFWMWVVAFLGMATAMVEATLAQVFKQRDPADGLNVFRGGPAFYYQRGLGSRKMGVAFSVLLLTAMFVFAMLKANSIASSARVAFGLPTFVTGFFATILLAAVVSGGIRRIATFSEFLVPIMAISYVFVALMICLANITELPRIFATIVTSAFGIGSAAGGASGWLVSQAMLNGVRRGMFSNDAGSGNAPNFAATADVKHPGHQAYVQALGVFFDTIIICTATAMVILLSKTLRAGMNVSGSELTQVAMREHVGRAGPIFIAISLMFFAFASALGNYYQGENALVFLDGSHAHLRVFKWFLIAAFFTGSLVKTEFIWDLADIAQGFTAMLNIWALWRMREIAITVIKDFEDQQVAGHDPVFDRRLIPELDSRIAPGVWELPGVVRSRDG